MISQSTECLLFLLDQNHENSQLNLTDVRHVIKKDAWIWSLPFFHSFSFTLYKIDTSHFPFVNRSCHFKQSMPPLVTKPLVLIDVIKLFPGLGYHKATSTFLNNLRKNDLEA